MNINTKTDFKNKSVFYYKNEYKKSKIYTDLIKGFDYINNSKIDFILNL